MAKDITEPRPKSLMAAQKDYVASIGKGLQDIIGNITNYQAVCGYNILAQINIQLQKEGLKEANDCFKNWQYNETIDLLQSVLPKLEEPRSFIYAKLGFSYQKTTYDGDYSKAIDYLILAQEQSKKEAEVRDYSKVIEELKSKSKYNGKVLTKK